MSFAYYPIENMKYNGNKVFYRNAIDITLQPAKILNDKYIYYYKSIYKESMQPLGKFKCNRNCNSGLRYNDYDYIVMVFVDSDEKETEISSTDIKNVYAEGIAEINHQMIQIKDMEYNDCPVYYQDLQLL